MGLIARNPIDEEFNEETQAWDSCYQKMGSIASNPIEGEFNEET